jgi:hypothetical protein
MSFSQLLFYGLAALLLLCTAGAATSYLAMQLQLFWAMLLAFSVVGAVLAILVRFVPRFPSLLMDPRLMQQLYSSSVLLPFPVTPQCRNGAQKTPPSISSLFLAAVAILRRCSPCFEIWILVQTNTPIEPTS